MKKNILFILLMTLVTSCGSKPAPEASAKLKKINLSEVTALTASLSDFSIKPDTLTMFFLPQAGTMNWTTTSFNSSDSDLNKWGSIMKDVITSSDNIDAVNLLKTDYETKDCLSDDTTTDCQAINAKFAKYSTDYFSSEIYVGEQLGVIQKAVDNCVVDGSIDESKQYNWHNYGADVKKFKIDLTDVANPILYFKQLGRSENQKYKSEDGDIVNIRYTNSEYAPNTMMLKFTLLEKDEDGNFNGNTWEVELEQMMFAGKIRFKGDVLKYNNVGKLIQRGIMKVELPKA